MFEAVRTTASPAAIWTIAVVAVGCLVFWLGAIALADKYPFWRQWQAPDMPGPALGGTEPLQAVPVQRSADADRPEHTVTGSGVADDSDG